MNFSNKSLAVMAFLILSFSIFGSIYSLNLLDGISVTGNAAAEDGFVNLSIAQTISINITDDIINFGECEVLFSPSRFDSSLGPSGENNLNCTSGTFPDNITIENIGNINVHVNASLSALPSTTYGNGDLSLKMANTTTGGGCMSSSSLIDYTTNFTVPGLPGAQDVCNNLTFGSQDQMVVYAKFWLSTGATSTGGNSTTVTFTASIS